MWPAWSWWWALPATMPADELIKGEEELSLEDLIQELEATTRTMDDNKEP